VSWQTFDCATPRARPRTPGLRILFENRDAVVLPALPCPALPCLALPCPASTRSTVQHSYLLGASCPDRPWLLPAILLPPHLWGLEIELGKKVKKVDSPLRPARYSLLATRYSLLATLLDADWVWRSSLTGRLACQGLAKFPISTRCKIADCSVLTAHCSPRTRYFLSALLLSHRLLSSRRGLPIRDSALPISQLQSSSSPVPRYHGPNELCAVTERFPREPLPKPAFLWPRQSTGDDNLDIPNCTWQRAPLLANCLGHATSSLKRPSSRKRVLLAPITLRAAVREAYTCTGRGILAAQDSHPEKAINMRIGIREQLAVIVLVTALLPLAVGVGEICFCHVYLHVLLYFPLQTPIPPKYIRRAIADCLVTQVLAIAIWVNNHNLVVTVTSQELTLAASLKVGTFHLLMVAAQLQVIPGRRESSL
jgi:hypothetical protein